MKLSPPHSQSLGLGVTVPESATVPDTLCPGGGEGLAPIGHTFMYTHTHTHTRAAVSGPCHANYSFSRARSGQKGEGREGSGQGLFLPLKRDLT